MEILVTMKDFCLTIVGSIFLQTRILPKLFQIGCGCQYANVLLKISNYEYLLNDIKCMFSNFPVQLNFVQVQRVDLQVDTILRN